MIENYYGHSQNYYGGDNCGDSGRYGGNCRGHAKVKAVMGMVVCYSHMMKILKRRQIIDDK